MARERLPPIVVGKFALLGLVLSAEEAERRVERERKGRCVVKKGRRQGALAQRMQAASSISLCFASGSFGGVRGRRSGRTYDQATMGWRVQVMSLLPTRIQVTMLRRRTRLMTQELFGRVCQLSE